MGIRIPDDLAKTDLGMASIARILEIRGIKKMNLEILTPPAGRKATAEARVVWAEAAEKAILNGQPEPEYPDPVVVILPADQARAG
jgi:hypothetical protein